MSLELRDEMTSEDVDAAARAWVLKLASGHATAEDAAEARRWIAAHPDHQAAFKRARDLWHEAQALEDAFRKPAPPSVARRWKQPLLAAAALLLVAVFTPFAIHQAALYAADYRSPSGEVTAFQLADGSNVWLDSDAAINISFTNERRGVELVSGRAFFAVAPNPRRPFVVSTKGGTATAVGTAYSVSQEADKVVVVVEEGHVRTATGSSSDLLSAGEQGGWSHGESLRPRGSDVRVSHAWKSGKILVENRPLSEAVALLDRYYPGVIFLRARGDVRVSAQFDIHRTPQGLAALAQSQDLEVSRWGPWITVLSEK